MRKISFPLKVVIDRVGFASVEDAEGEPIVGLGDIELGWTDPDTGPYVDPEEDLEQLCYIVGLMNYAAENTTEETRQMRMKGVYDSMYRRGETTTPLSLTQKAIIAAQVACRAWGDGINDFGIGGNSMVDLILDNVDAVASSDEAVQIMNHRLFRENVPFVLMNQLKERYESI